MLVRTIWKNAASATCVFAVTLATPLSAGGLANQIVEEEQIVPPAAPVAQNALAGWVLPVVGLLALGAVVAASDDDGGSSTDDDGDGDGPPIIIDPK